MTHRSIVSDWLVAGTIKNDDKLKSQISSDQYGRYQSVSDDMTMQKLYMGSN